MTTNRSFSYGWAAGVAMGVLMILGGIFCIGASLTTGLVTVVFAGVLLVAAGVSEIIAGFRLRRHGSMWLPFLSGALSIVVGVAIVSRPFTGLAVATLFIGAFMVAAGLVRGIAAVADRYPRWGWDALYGVVALLLGVYLLASWPVSALWLVGTIVGVELVSRGIAWVVGSLAMRRVVRTREGRIIEGAAAPA
ncbi:HdeD family acid-resistance protein [Sandaracinus amylolyticus]|uniref:HDED protein n=1 Tax=Sandaracinus amylolyticus TaxID=927083 RepID=A0A0F6YNF0_9BACT|nr:HdeD family acid-resistance protein [Sandaracinus amylolyticus]AKF10347.1 hypothetical protein DB32_007496 [Sandaracinus amylolyticus]